jgi:hypothetical protein
MARTAVVAGTATAVSGGMVRHAQNKEMQAAQADAYQQQQMQQQMQEAAEAAVAAQAPPPAAAAAPAPEAAVDPMIAKLQQLAELKAQGILSDEEFAAAKAKLLA